MKKQILFTITSILLTSAAFAQENNVTADFKSKAYDILNKKSSTIKLSGDIKKGEKLSSILKNLNLYFAGQDKQGSVKDFSMNCEMYPRGIGAKCILFIQHNPIGETGIEFVVGLDSHKMPESVMENRANVYRGD